MPTKRDFSCRAAVLAALAALVLAGACSPEGAAVGAGATAGVVAAQERSAEDAASDARIRVEINHLWLQSSEDLYRSVNLQVQEGRVLLSGNVRDPETRLNAVRSAWQVRGVREVINEIAITDRSSLGDVARDNWIATQLKGKLLMDMEVRSINYSIECVNGVIYLMGVAQDLAELDRVVGHAKELPYVRRVVNYVRMKDELDRG